MCVLLIERMLRKEGVLESPKISTVSKTTDSRHQNKCRPTTKLLKLKIFKKKISLLVSTLGRKGRPTSDLEGGTRSPVKKIRSRFWGIRRKTKVNSSGGKVNFLHYSTAPPY